MREVQLYPSVKRDRHVVRRLQFVAGGAELVAWTGRPGAAGRTSDLRCISPGTDEARSLTPDGWEFPFEINPDPVVSPDGRFLAFSEYTEDDVVYFRDLARHEEHDLELPPLPGAGALVVTPDGSALLAVRMSGDDRTREVVRFALATYINPPLRVEARLNPLNQQTYRVPIYEKRWEPVLDLPPGKHTSAVGLSADGRLLAVGDVAGGVLVAGLKRKKVVASFRRAWPKAVRAHERAATRVAFAGAERVLTLANGRLFADPLGDGKAWKSGPAVGAVNDFAVHPSGRFVCAACADGSARYLDPRTGAVTAAFKWAKRSPKPLHSVAFAPDGLTCAAGTGGGKVFIWDVDA